MRITPEHPPSSIRILGAGCARCRVLTTRTRASLDALGIDTPVEVVDDPWMIADYGVIRIPALDIGGQVVLTGNVPRSKDLRTLIEGAINP